MSISDLLDQLGEAKGHSNEAYKAYKNYKEREEIIKTELMATLRGARLKSAKSDQYTASISEKPTVVITDEAAVIEWLENTPNVESDFYIGVKKPEFNTLAKQMLKETGELADGTELEVRESLAIRSNKK